MISDKLQQIIDTYNKRGNMDFLKDIRSRFWAGMKIMICTKI